MNDATNANGTARQGLPGPEADTPATPAAGLPDPVRLPIEPGTAKGLEDVLRRLAERLQPADPLLIDARKLAGLLDVSLGTVERMKAAGDLPAHVVVSGNCHRWRLEEIRRWVEAGCPPRKQWEALNGRAGRT